ncbi:MAG: succinylglutamate desuccinylase/aspartoacylase family protein [Candidatus Bathyarchaeota archaeon]|nr:succinylglutamate desuccinylase/aspartoacylase family protein [Candidatus Bathyarchaeota archaeon]
MHTIRVGDTVAAPGEKKRGTLQVPGNHDPDYNPKIIIVNGAKAGKTLVITGGVHGTEFASIEAVTRFANMLDPTEMSGSVIAIPVANVPQFRERTQFVCPVDGLNLNDSFPGKKDGSFTERLAYALFDVICLGEAYIDCHGGDINEDILGFVVAADSGNPALNNASLELAQCYNTGFIHYFPAEPGLSISAQKLLGIPSIMPEAGTPFPVTEESVLFHVEGLMNVLRYLEIIEGEVVRYQSFVSPERIKLYSSHDGVWESYVELNQRVEKDEPVGAVKNPFGDVLEVVKAPERGIIGMKRCYYSVKNGEMLVVLSTF